MSVLRTVLTRLPGILLLAGWTVAAVIAASAMVARDIMAPSARLAPAIVIVPLRCRNRWELSVLMGVITITPGTLVVGIRPEREEVWVHGMYGRDPDALRADIERVQARVVKALRRRGPQSPTDSGPGA